MRNTLRTVAGLSAAVLAASALVSCSTDEDATLVTVTSTSGVVTSPAGTPSSEPTEGAEDPGDEGDAASSDDDAVAAALATLDTLEVKGRAPKTGYDRALFGQAWADVDRNGCDTRNDILARDLTDITYKDGTCRVLTGTLDDPYTGRTINFVRGQDTSTAVQIDHLVALSDAWQKGAQQLSPERREQLANDPANLLAVDGPANMQKSDGDAATWLPANKSFRCTYVSKQIDVKAAYALWVTQAEKDAMVRILSNCGAEGIAAGDAPVAGDNAGAPAEAPVEEPAAPAPAAPPAAADVPADPAGVYYANCSAAKAAGAAPLYRGDPGYRSGMDGDNDGVACE